jgi:TonB family protein
MKKCNAGEFRVTMIDNTSLLERLATEFRFLIEQLRQVWPDVKRDPIGFGKSALVASGLRLRRVLTTPDSLAALATAILLVISAVLVVVLIGNKKENDLARSADQDRELGQIVEFLPNPNVPPEDRGVGAGSKEGRVGFAGGRGEGSAPEPKKSTGGGGGGNHDLAPTQVGKPPQPSPIPAPIPKFPPVQKQSLPVAGIDIDPALWKSLPMANYGDPRSKSSAPSNGPGDGGGMGTANGTGIGEGSGPGFGPGNDGNIGDGRKGLGCCGPGGSEGSNADPDRVYAAPQVTERARVLAKAEPQYTEDARRNQITGSVVLRVVFSRTGEVTNIRALHALPFGLTERAIAAARQIRFRPATKDGRPVNVYMQLEYNFNLY